MAFAAAHPRRTIPKFGPYLLLQTLGEGEFGKVKLGLHCQWGEEVAVKLIRRGNVDTAVRMSKVEREIEVLRTLKHPNIVRLYDVIETDKYIGIIIEYASGGELFDHILAHRYLRERDASKLFSQLISGVWYIHQKKIVHRDLKLENLLLDRHRNVIITDFGFANRFEHRADDLMQTSCGSPCYAAPELVISEGLYVGSAVDIWSCGVILYAMLAGYLPFDDDPANPDGDNINLLYKYIVSTPLSFPEYVSEAARDLLGMMLVPDPRRRAGLEEVCVFSFSSFPSPFRALFLSFSPPSCFAQCAMRGVEDCTRTRSRRAARALRTRKTRWCFGGRCRFGRLRNARSILTCWDVGKLDHCARDALSPPILPFPTFLSCLSPQKKETQY
ncbi:kinase-like domain-containing protein [Mycena vitilis]|nr:kinase-like domain-containing protein [Mycena vitilis]